MKEYTAIIRRGRGLETQTYVRHSVGEHRSMKSFAEEIRANGFRVVKIFNGYFHDAEVDMWLYVNRKNG